MSGTRQRIVLMPPNWLGDVVLAQPALRALARHYPEAELLVFGRAWLEELLPFLYLEHARARYVADFPSGADAAFLFPNSFRSAWQAFRGGVKMRVGFRKDGRSLLLTHGYKPRVDLITQHHRLYYLDLLRQHGISTPFEEVALQAPEHAGQEAISLLRAKGMNPEKTVCVAPGAQFGGAKRYPAESYAVVLRHLSEQGWDIMVLGTAAERDIAEQCLSLVSGMCWNAAGETTLAQALAVVSQARLMLCNDSGLMHVAAGLGVPTVALFGATNPARTSPSGPCVQVLFKPALCSPCLQRECDVLGHPCMANILPEDVVHACRHGLSASGAGD